MHAYVEAMALVSGATFRYCCDHWSGVPSTCHASSRQLLTSALTLLPPLQHQDLSAYANNPAAFEANLYAMYDQSEKRRIPAWTDRIFFR